ncbi:hypothetical protein ACPOL_1557 [Acidisarcina polymorpha]|uniref:Uncharacterized protein n=1 Tax=Acidisarcina polymorpha TaxID=2211140 RepID=A0A2Z5FVI7_9BACT|nr:hypothetical protein [Acidisarcina polymorpha]AXC10903.1 hypothetical protein ACPOL_1557 [Acidisarcina polymorpha]
MNIRLLSTFLAGSLAATTLLPAQQHAAAPSAPDGSIPDIKTLMLQVQAHQRQLDQVRENYTFREVMQTDDLDSNGQVKKTETEEYEVFYVNSHHIQRLVKKNGKQLSADEQKKEQDRVTKEVEKATKLEPGKSLNADQISITRILAIMKVSNPRRVALNGRPTIAFDFVGDPHAQTHGMAEDASKKIAGTLWVDEKDREVAKLTVHFDDNFHVGAGIVATVQKGSSFEFEQAIVNNELWLPTSGEAHLTARVLLVKGYRQNMHFRDSDYQRFHTDASQQAGATIHTP